VIAFDFSDRLLAQPRRRVSSDRVHFFEHDVSKPWPIPDQSADLVLDSLVLEHVADLGMVFQQARRVLKPGGPLFVCELHPFRQISGAQAILLIRPPVAPYMFQPYVAMSLISSTAAWRRASA